MLEFEDAYAESPHEFVDISLNSSYEVTAGDPILANSPVLLTNNAINQANIPGIKKPQIVTPQKNFSQNEYIKHIFDRANETLAQLAIKYNVSEQDILRANQIIDLETFRGEVLRIPNNRGLTEITATDSPSAMRKLNIPAQRFHIPSRLFSSNNKQISDHRALVGFSVVENWSMLSCSIDVFDVLTDMKLFHISMDMFSIFPTYRITQFDQEIAKCTMVGDNVKKIVFLYKRRDKKEELHAMGDFLGNNYQIKRFEHVLAKASRESWARNKCFSLQILPNEDVLHVIAMVVIIERCVQNIRDEQVLRGF